MLSMKGKKDIEIVQVLFVLGGEDTDSEDGLDAPLVIVLIQEV